MVYNLICKQQEEKNTLSIQQLIKMGKKRYHCKAKKERYKTYM